MGGDMKRDYSMLEIERIIGLALSCLTFEEQIEYLSRLTRVIDGIKGSVAPDHF